MLLNYLKTTIRHLRNNLFFSLVSIVGLILGLLCFMLIGLVVLHESSYDQFHSDANVTYRVSQNVDHNGLFVAARTGFAIGEIIEENNPVVVDYIRFLQEPRRINFKVEDKTMYHEFAWFVDSNFFDFFDFPLIVGNSDSLASPRNAYITPKIALGFFNSLEEAIGDSIYIGKWKYRISGIVDNKNMMSDLPFNALVSMNTLSPSRIKMYEEDLFFLQFMTYIKTNEELSKKQIQNIKQDVRENHIIPWARKYSAESDSWFNIDPLTSLRFNNSYDFDTPKANGTILFIFGIIGLCLLLTSCINYINLSLSTSSKRVIEIGMRKSLGAQPWQITLQFLGESFFIVSICCLIALSLTEISLPLFNEMIGTSLQSNEIFNPASLILIFLIISLTTVLSGIYPAIKFSKLKPNEILKGEIPLFRQHQRLGKVLIFSQLSFMFLIIMSTLFAFLQLKSLRDADLGFDKENIYFVKIPLDKKLFLKMPDMLKEFYEVEGVEAITTSNSIPTLKNAKITYKVQKEDSLVDESAATMFIDDAFVNVYGIHIIQGRNFNEKTDTIARAKFLINKAAAKAYGWQKPLDKTIQFGLGNEDEGIIKGKVIGVVENFQFSKNHSKIEPLILTLVPYYVDHAIFKINPKHSEKTLAQIKDIWMKNAPDMPFDITSFRHKLDQNYQTENRVFKAFSFFTTVALFISSIGLLALLSFNMEQRTKEIGLRSLFGASSFEISKLLLKGITGIMITSLLLVSIVGYYVANKWLNLYFFHADLSLWPVLFACLNGFLIISIAVIFQIIKLKRHNPIFSLQHE